MGVISTGNMPMAIKPGGNKMAKKSVMAKDKELDKKMTAGQMRADIKADKKQLKEKEKKSKK